jgi:outer membrane protein assembly factor BamB
MRTATVPADGLTRTFAALDLPAPLPRRSRRKVTRRLLLAAGVCALLAVGLSLVFVTAGPPAPDGLWTMFRGGPQRTGLGGGSGATGTLLWEFQTGKDAKGFFGVESSPAVGKDGAIYVGASDEKVYALDGKTGQKKWEFRTGGNVTCSPAVSDDGTVYVGSWDTKLYALDGATGAEKWELPMEGGVYSSPAIGEDGSVYVGAFCFVYALDGATGDVIWGTPLTGRERGGSVSTAPALSPDGLLVYAGMSNNNRAYGLYALDTKTGDVKWRFPTSSHVLSSPAVSDDGRVYFGCDNGCVYALDGETGEQKWEFAAGTNPVRSSPAVSRDGTVYIGAEGSLYALDGATGKVKAEFKMLPIVTSSPAIGSDGTVYVAEDLLYALDANLSRKWDFRPRRDPAAAHGDSMASSPAIGPDGTIYIGTYNGKVVAVR